MAEYFRDFTQLLTQMRWTDYVDILSVAFLLYMIFPLLRSSGATRILRVIAAILVISWLTSVLNLNALNFLMDQILTVGLIALVVLFQPELRRGLDHLGSVRIKELVAPQKETQQIEQVIAQTVAACEVMSREKVGALIVFARTNRLDELFKTGTVIDAQVSEQLIRNIFFPKAALHDGAMIIRDGRVAVAGCVLPLSESTRLSADLGTRHRAGVGASETTDAVVVIVSEETGTISVAVGGMLKRHLAAQTLEKLLRRELSAEDPAREESLTVRLRQKLGKRGKDGGGNA